ncbi:MAG TPA: sodium:proton antiporter NhaD [Spirochaetia bacterium]|nr:sodium:proton antiporter NhaD [Spirochaetia bacterium]
MVIYMAALFVVGYAGIALEHNIKINKSATALLTGVGLWVIYIVSTPNKPEVLTNLTEYLGETSSVLFFILAAMTIVELIDAHDGFDIIVRRITIRRKVALLWVTGGITFILSAIIDNLTTTIVMITLLRKLIFDKQERLLFVGAVIVAANAGGAWSPIGDVTTTMLWIGDRISSVNAIRSLFLPSLLCTVVPLLFISFRLKGDAGGNEAEPAEPKVSVHRSHQLLVFSIGIFVFLMIPVFKAVTGLPPMMGVLAGLGILWIVIEIIHINREEEHKKFFSVVQALRNIDASSILFFLGILLSVDALQSTGILAGIAQWLDGAIGNHNIIVAIIGLASSIIDNVPLVAATMGMYPLELFPKDNALWELIAYAAGTGGSVLVIGSAAGIAAMGLETVGFTWYLKNISLWALLGFAVGFVAYIIAH